MWLLPIHAMVGVVSHIQPRRALGRCCWLSVLLLHVAACANVGIKPESIDADRDGVRDSVDACKNTPSGTPINKAGCSLFNRILSGVIFEPGEHAIDVDSRQALNELVVQLAEYPDVSLNIEAHTDNRGNARDNLELSKERVMSVVRYLVLNGVDGRRLQPTGLGESRPLVSNASEEGRGKNRRIEITLVHSHGSSGDGPVTVAQ